MISRIAIVNRGEAAMRLIHAVRDLNAGAGPGGHRIETIALHTEGERRAMFVRESDHAYDLGPASARPYLDHAVLERALCETNADAAWYYPKPKEGARQIAGYVAFWKGVAVSE